MDDTDIFFWIVLIPTLSTFVTALIRHRSSAQGWIAVSGTILGVLFFAWLRRDNTLVYVALGLWVLLVIVPGTLARTYNARLLQQRYRSAYNFARVISIFHPFDGWREQPKIVRALDLAFQDDVAGAVEILKRFQHVVSPAAHTAMINLYRITNRWEEFLAWAAQLPSGVSTNWSFIPVLLRARAEVGDVRGMIELYDRNKNAIAKMAPSANRDFCRLVLFAFTGRRDLVQRLMAGSLQLLPNTAKQFWLATADLTAGNSEAGIAALNAQLQSADPATRRAIERRLSKALPSSAVLDRAHWQIVEDAAREHGHEEIFHAAPPLLSRASRATQLIIAANLVMFALEVYLGGATNGDVLMRLGALYPPAVHAGEWWRLLAAMFLHFGALHVTILVYLGAGLGSMWVVMKFGSGPHSHQVTVGASGCIMGLVGATGGLVLKGWLRERAHPAKRRLRAVITILFMQTVFDAMIPQVSMTAHLSGAFFGFLIALLLPNQLGREGA
jgi:rhomboid protease GluP